MTAEKRESDIIRRDVVVVIPIYKKSLSPNELLSLVQCFKILSKHPIVLIKPSSLVLADLGLSEQFSDVLSFEDRYFANIHGYNELMLSTQFYKRFLGYNYMLIYQLDAIVFSDQLEYWCNQNYDYIGAPWLYPSSLKSWHINPVIHFKSLLYRRYNMFKNGLPRAKQLFNQVGNGGLSLRKTSKFYALSRQFRKEADLYIGRREHQFNEDVFWSIELNRKGQNLRIPNYKIAANFAIENQPRLAFQLTHNELPFGTHAWEKHLEFWAPLFQHYNINLNVYEYGK